MHVPCCMFISLSNILTKKTQVLCILVITVAHNPLRAAGVPVYTKLIDRKTSHLNNMRGNFRTLGNYLCLF